jgi:hypothetical protein
VYLYKNRTPELIFSAEKINEAVPRPFVSLGRIKESRAILLEGTKHKK